MKFDMGVALVQHPYLFKVNIMSTNRVLVLFSGGKDSFLSACSCIEEGMSVGLLSFNNGCIAGEQNFKHSATRLINKYGEAQVTFEGIYNTYATVLRLSQWWLSTPLTSIANKYPNLDAAQVRCLHCQTAMWASAIAYAKARGFSVLCSGCRDEDVYCTGSKRYLDYISDIAKTHDLVVKLPLWETPKGVRWDAYRDQEMVSFGFYPSVLEPQCQCGYPVSRPVAEVEDELCAYFTEHLRDIMQRRIPRLREALRRMRLSDKSLSVGKYPIPTGDSGLY